MQSASKFLFNTIRRMSFYAVAQGRKVGVYKTWAECEQQTKGFKGAKYKKFPTRVEAESFIKNINTGNTEIYTESVTKKFTPPDNPVALGKRCTAPWKDDAESKYGKRKMQNEVKDFWPEDDEFDETQFTDEELIAGMAACEGNQNTVEYGGHRFIVDGEGRVIVYTDGSCINNGKADAHAGYGIYFGPNHALNAAKPVTGRPTNNVGEIQAAINAIQQAIDLNIPSLCIMTDSQFLIKSVTQYMDNWKKRDWRRANGGPVKNAVDFKKLNALLESGKVTVKWVYVQAHKGIEGNEMADKLANEGAVIYKKNNLKGK